MVSCALYSISQKAKTSKDPLVLERIQLLKDQLPEGESSLVLALGGDGEVLNAFRNHPDRTILGIKIDDSRSLGYYSAINLQDIDHHTIEKIQDDNYHVTKLPLLSCRIGEKEYKVFNDASVLRKHNGKSGEFRVTIGKDRFDVFGDGIILCTPQGSTGYNFSSGGSIINWDLRVYGVRFFNISHGLRSISTIVPENTETAIQTIYAADVEMDGTSHDLEKGATMTARFSKEYAQLVSLGYHSQMDRFKSMVRSNTLDR